MGETPPTFGTLKRFLGRVSGNVLIKMFLRFEFFPAKCARKSDRILGMINFHVMLNVSLVFVGFLTAEKSAWKTGSFTRAVNGVNVFP